MGKRERFIERLECQYNLGMCHGSIRKVDESLQTCLTPTQIECLLQKKAVKRWEEEDIRRAVTLWSFSPESFNYLRETMKFPLPSAATLIQLSVEQGLQLPVMKLLHNKSASVSQYERLCVLIKPVSRVSVSMTRVLTHFMALNVAFSTQC